MTTKQQIPTTTSIGQHCSTTKRRFSVTFLFSSAQYWYMGNSLPTSRPASIWELFNMFDPLSSKKRRQWQKIGNMYSFLARIQFLFYGLWKSIGSILKYAWAAHILFGRHSEIMWINHGPKSASYPESPELVNLLRASIYVIQKKNRCKNWPIFFTA